MILPTKDTPFNLFVGSIVVDFPSDNVVISSADDDWKKWGNFLVQENSFLKNAAPSPSMFNDRTEWEQAVFHAMSSSS